MSGNKDVRPDPFVNPSLTLPEAVRLVQMREEQTARIVYKDSESSYLLTILKTAEREAQERERIIKSGSDYERQTLALELARLLPDFNVSSDPRFPKTIRVLHSLKVQHVWHKKTEPSKPTIVKIMLRPGSNTPGLS